MLVMDVLRRGGRARRHNRLDEAPNRGRWIDALLEGLPSDIPAAARDRLAAALVPLFGSDAIVWTTDIAQLSRDEAIELLAWMAHVLIAATLAGR
jgi:hypothetical protein